MPEVERPSPFELKDALSYALPSFIVTLFAIWVQTTEQTLEAYALMWTVAAGCWFVYIMLVRSRAQMIAKYPLMSKHGIMVNPGGYMLLQSELDEAIDELIKMYEALPPFQPPAPADAVRKQITNLKDRVWVTFLPGPFDHPQLGAKFKIMGFVKVGGDFPKVGYREPDDPIRKTAFFHEMGHVILGRYWNNWDGEKHHAFMRRHKLP